MRVYCIVSRQFLNQENCRFQFSQAMFRSEWLFQVTYSKPDLRSNFLSSLSFLVCTWLNLPFPAKRQERKFFFFPYQMGKQVKGKFLCRRRKEGGDKNLVWYCRLSLRYSGTAKQQKLQLQKVRLNFNCPFRELSNLFRKPPSPTPLQNPKCHTHRTLDRK